jgi:hypothetical protein
MTETPVEYLYKKIMADEIKSGDFLALLSLFVGKLEEEIKESRADYTELAFILAMTRNPSWNHGTPEELEERAVKALAKAHIFEKKNE